MEQWKAVEGYEGFYEVSTKDGKVRNVKTGRILKQYDNGSGYFLVGLYQNGKKKDISVHRLVATAFIPNPDNLPEVDHINRNRHDNSVENLRWVDRQTNVDNTDCAKRVYCVELDRIFDSITQAEVEIGCKHIGEVCNGARQTAGGFHWYFVEEK